MAADVFETYAVSLIGAILVGALTLANTPAAIIYPFVLGGISVLGAISGILFVNVSGGKPGHGSDGRRRCERARLGDSVLAGDALSFPGRRHDRWSRANGDRSLLRHR